MLSEDSIRLGLCFICVVIVVFYPVPESSRAGPFLDVSIEKGDGRNNVIKWTFIFRSSYTELTIISTG